MPIPSIRTARSFGGGPVYRGYHYWAGLIRSVLPLMEQSGVATAEEKGIETLYEGLRDEVVGLGGVIAFSSLMGACDSEAHREDNNPSCC